MTEIDRQRFLMAATIASAGIVLLLTILLSVSSISITSNNSYYQSQP